MMRSPDALADAEEQTGGAGPNKLIEDTLGTRSTGRNWNTVRKLAALAEA